MFESTTLLMSDAFSVGWHGSEDGADGRRFSWARAASHDSCDGVGRPREDLSVSDPGVDMPKARITHRRDERKHAEIRSMKIKEKTIPSLFHGRTCDENRMRNHLAHGRIAKSITTGMSSAGLKNMLKFVR